MIEWFRSWHGAPTDPKWLVIARKAGVAPGLVSAVVWALLDHASQASPRGDVSTFDVETYAAFSGFEEGGVTAVIVALNEKGVILQGVLSAWEKRQPNRDGDNSTDRVRAFRQRQREQQNAPKRDETQRNATERQSREEENREDKTDSRARATVDEAKRLLDEFWAAYPHRAGGNPRLPAAKKFLTAISSGRKHEIDRDAAAAIIGGARRFAAECRERGKIGTEYVPHAATWLNQRRWEGYPEKPETPAAAVPPDRFYAKAESAELAAWDRYMRATRGKGLPRDKAGGWLVDGQWPPRVELEPTAAADKAA